MPEPRFTMAEISAQLLSDEAVDAARIGSGVRGHLTAENVRAALRAALASQEKTEGEQ